ncbi:MAG: DMT family transporter, partial [archaeon]|nr:DMT family transporter [archaeon]
VMAFFGCILVTGLATQTLSFDMAGCAFALGSGISYAAYTVGTKLFLDRGYSEGTTLFYMFMIGTVLCVPFVDMGAMVGRFDTGSLLNLVAIGVFMTLVPYALVAYALKKGNAVKVNLLGLLEVVFAALVGFVFYGETIAVLNLVGMGLIMFSVVYMNLGEGNGA